MKRGILGTFLMAAALVTGAAAAQGDGSNKDLETRVRHEILMYSNYTLWDDISFRVDNGNVSLLGAVSQPYKKSDIGRIVQHVPGVASVTNEIKVLPLSFQDDRLRLQVARTITGKLHLVPHSGSNACGRFGLARGRSCKRLFPPTPYSSNDIALMAIYRFF